MGSQFNSQFVTCIVLSLIIGSIVGGNAWAADALKPRIDRLAQPYVDAKIVVGMTIGVVQRGEETVVGFGHFATDHDRQPDGDTVYEIGSTTKVFTGLLLADAVARGRLRLDQPARELLPPEVKMPVRGERTITLQDLATHVSGLPRMPDNFRPADVNNPHADYTIEQLHEFLNGHQLVRSPGEKSEYSNLAVGLLGHLLARNASLTYEELMREQIAEPLDMHDTVIKLNDDLRGRLAPPHLADGTAASNWDIPPPLAGAGAIRSTANDMLRFIAANLKPPAGTLGTAIETAWTIHQPPLAEGDLAKGLGWLMARDGQTRWHNGQSGGYHAALFVNRQIDAGVVVLANTATMEVDQLAEQIIRMLAGATVEPRTFEKPVEADIAPEIMQRYPNFPSVSTKSVVRRFFGTLFCRKS
jgi:CubicO group peptidase (beta-lactamase class C family)